MYKNMRFTEVENEEETDKRADSRRSHLYRDRCHQRTHKRAGKLHPAEDIHRLLNDSFKLLSGLDDLKV